MGKYAVIGLGKFGVTVATTLYENGAEVIAIDNDSEKIEEISGNVTSAIVMNSTNERALKQNKIQDMDAVIIAIGDNLEVNVLTSVILKKIGVSNIFAKVNSKIHARILELIGIKNIIFPEEQIGVQLANSILSKGVLDYVKLSSGHTVVEMEVPKSWIGKTLLELALPSKKGVNIVSITSKILDVTEEGENIIKTVVNDMPGANDVLRENDILLIIGAKDKINNLISETSKE